MARAGWHGAGALRLAMRQPQVRGRDRTRLARLSHALAGALDELAHKNLGDRRQHDGAALGRDSEDVAHQSPHARSREL